MTFLSRTVVALAVVLSLMASAGCFYESGKGTVNGEVTLDGQPLKEGTVRFEPVDGKSPTASATIVDGRFSAAVPVGEQRVQISAPRVVGKTKMLDTPDCPEVDKVEELIPECYNLRSELNLTVQAGSQEKRFELKTK
jgi:hypothetical protein